MGAVFLLESFWRLLVGADRDDACIHSLSLISSPISVPLPSSKDYFQLAAGRYRQVLTSGYGSLYITMSPLEILLGR